MIGGFPISIIAARARGCVIGASGDVPWHIPTDLARFKALTLGKPLIVGRKTFASIGRVLPGRTMIVLSRAMHGDAAPGVVLAMSLQSAFSIAVEYARNTGTTEIMIAGGAQVYEASLPFADRLYLTEVDLHAAGDAYFPKFDATAWQEVARATPPRRPGDEAAIRFVDLRRVRSDTPL